MCILTFFRFDTFYSSIRKKLDPVSRTNIVLKNQNLQYMKRFGMLILIYNENN
jgi:hypothetical protein